MLSMPKPRNHADNESEGAAFWLAKLSALRVDSSAKRRLNVAERFSPEIASDPRCLLAPYKALLLLCVLDEYEAGMLRDGTVTRDAELGFRYESYFSLVVERCGNKADVRMPFHALGGDGVWMCLNDEGRRSFARETTRRCVLDPGLLKLLEDPVFRRSVRLLLVNVYFPPYEQTGVIAALQITDFHGDEPAQLRIQAKAFIASQQRRGRDARFRVDVVTRYRFTCALTGYRLTTEQANIVEAAHIAQWSQTGDDDPQNGLALTPNAHWMFDHGLWSIDDRGLIVVQAPTAFTESSLPGGFLLRQSAGLPPHFDSGSTLRPDPLRLAAHYARHFGKAE